MPNVKFIASFGDINKTVEITNVSGAGGTYHVYIDRYYQGTLSIRNGRWEFMSQLKENFSVEDIQDIEEIMTQHNQIQ